MKGELYILVRKGRYCGIINRFGVQILGIEYLTIIPPINSELFVVQKKGKWGVINLNGNIVTEFGKYKYLWGYDDGLSSLKLKTLTVRLFAIEEFLTLERYLVEACGSV